MRIACDPNPYNLTVRQIFRAGLVYCNGNYIGIRIGITRNKRYCNVILITIYLFGDNIIIEL